MHPVQLSRFPVRVVRFATVAICLCLGAVGSPAPAAAAATVMVAEAVLHGPGGEVLGRAQLSALSHGVRIRLEVQGLEPGSKAFHVHETGTCTAPDFTSAGGHFNPDDADHGFHGAAGPHAGDMPNLWVGEDGRGRVEVINERVRLDDGPRGLFRKGGTALVIHAGPDDYASQPAGAAGPRIACGVIRAAPQGDR